MPIDPMISRPLAKPKHTEKSNKSIEGLSKVMHTSGRSDGRILPFVKNFGLVLVALAILVIVQNFVIGLILLMIYAVLVVIKRWNSRVSFMLAGVPLLYLPIMLVRGQPEAHYYAQYAFLLLVIGLISLIRELVVESKKML